MMQIPNHLISRRLLPGLLLFQLLTGTTAAQAVTQPAKENVLLMENFDNQSGIAWPEVNHADTATAKIINGQYVLDAKKAARFWALRLGVPALSARPTILEMKMKATGDSTGIVCGILWHTLQTDPHTFVEYSFLVSNTGLFSVSYGPSGAHDYMKYWTACTCIQKDGYNTLRIEQSGDMYYFFINSILVYQSRLNNAELTTMGFYSDPHSILQIDYIKLAVQQ